MDPIRISLARTTEPLRIEERKSTASMLSVLAPHFQMYGWESTSGSHKSRTCCIRTASDSESPRQFTDKERVSMDNFCKLSEYPVKNWLFTSSAGSFARTSDVPNRLTKIQLSELCGGRTLRAPCRVPIAQLLSRSEALISARSSQ